MITESDYNEIQKASIIIILGLFTCLAHKYIPKDIIFTFPFLETLGGYEDWCFSWSPEEPLHHPLQSTISILLDGLFVIIYVPTALIVGQMKFPITFNLRILQHIRYKGVYLIDWLIDKKYDVWFGLILFEALKRVDIMLSYRHIPFRSWAIIILMCAQVYYLYYSYKQVAQK